MKLVIESNITFKLWNTSAYQYCMADHIENPRTASVFTHTGAVVVSVDAVDP